MYPHATVDLNKVSAQGKNFNWKRPKCPKGCPKMWGHGYILRYYSRYPHCIYIKRYRCPSCGAVVTLTPNEFWEKYQSSIFDIYNAIKIRLTSYKWPPWVTRQRAGHWMRKFLSHLKINYGLDNEGQELIARLETLYCKKIPFLS